MSKKCIQCGAELEDNAIFCDECGAQQAVQKTMVSPTGIQVSQVNAQIPPTNQAAQWGNQIPVNPGMQSVNQSQNIIKNSAWGIASFILGIIAICTFGILLIPAILSIIMGIVAIKDPNVKHGLPVAGLIMSVISLIILFILMII